MKQPGGEVFSWNNFFKYNKNQEAKKNFLIYLSLLRNESSQEA